MESVLESGARRTCTTAARGATSADTDAEEPPECPHPSAAPIQTAISAIAATPTRIDDLLRMPTVTHLGPQRLQINGQAYKNPLKRAYSGSSSKRCLAVKK